MAVVTSYSTLKTWLASVLNRDDLTTDIPTLIQMAEARLKRERRAKLLVDLSPLSVSSDDTDLPADFNGFQSLYFNGDTYFGPIDIVSPNALAEYRRKYGTSSFPRAVAVISDGSGNRARWAPSPDQTYSLQATYWAKLTELSDSNPTNRWLDEHPDLYQYAALVEAAAFLRDDERIPTWERQYERRLQDLYEDTQGRLYSGRLVRMPPRSF